MVTTTERIRWPHIGSSRFQTVLKMIGAALTAVLLQRSPSTFMSGSTLRHRRLYRLPKPKTSSGIGITIGGWLVALAIAVRGSRSRTASPLAIVDICRLGFGGIVAIALVPPGSTAFQYQLFAHVGCVVFGGLASVSLWS